MPTVKPAKKGRPRAPLPIDEIMRWYRNGESIADIAHSVCMHPFSLRQRLKKDGYLLG